ncbi:MAG: hypothetical protein NVS3B21_25450 [Acidimicrobiales bacterium]
MSQFVIRLEREPAGLDFFVAVAMHLPSVEVVGLASEPDAVVELAARERPDVMVLDSDALANANDVIRQVHDVAPTTRVVMVSGDGFVGGPSAFAAGAAGHLERSLRPEVVVEEVTTLVNGALRGTAAVMAPDPGAARRARTFAGQAVKVWGRDQLEDAVKLLVSELVGNAVRHADSDIEVVIRLLDTAVRVEVRDDVSSMPRLVDAADDDESGRGLAIVDALASRWGVDVRGQGKSVWFELNFGEDAYRSPGCT